MSWTPPSEEQLQAILADSNRGEGGPEEERCQASGPTGYCHRSRGHQDDSWNVMFHVTYDNDRYEEWPVGWYSLRDRASLVLSERFGAGVLGSPEYKKGFQECLELVQHTLRTETREGTP